MNTPAHDEDELRCAEYALGVLDAGERAALEADVVRNPALQRALDDWNRRLAPLSLDVRPVTPPGRVWTRITRDLGFLAPPAASQPQSAPPATGWWNSLSLWRWLGIGASIAALALLAVNLRQAPQQQPVPTATTAANAYMVATIASKEGVANWTATVDVRNARMVVVPAMIAAVDADKATELWLIVPNEKPIALGVFPARVAATMQLPPDIMARLDAQAVLAVSLEPPGGSPTGQPTGPVLATGAVHAS
jgi:anti-sigma-K factor RskA